MAETHVTDEAKLAMISVPESPIDIVSVQSGLALVPVPLLDDPMQGLGRGSLHCCRLSLIKHPYLQLIISGSLSNGNSMAISGVDFWDI